MRLLSSIFLLTLSAHSFAVPCTSADFPPGGGLVNSCTSLTVDTPINFATSAGALPIEFDVSGDVFINADININGQDGVHYFDDSVSPGVFGGPGASEGGGLISTFGTSGSDLSANDGGTDGRNGNCNHGGGGGGGVTTAGQDGIACPTGTSTPGAGGLVYAFPSGSFRGGFGGGAGGAATVSFGVYDVGGGGGGGGGLRISASGTITVKNGVRLSARGGRGGNAIELGGAGGGGGGGVIWLESPFPIFNKGIIDVSGGEGGINTRATAPRGGNGGRGGDGVFRVEIAGVVTDSSGIVDLSSPVRNLKSDISCGTIAKVEEDHLIFKQMILGFILAMMIVRILSRFQKKV